MTAIKLFLLCHLAANRRVIGRWLLAILQPWPGAGTPHVVLLVQRISEDLLRSWSNQGAVRAGQQGRGGTSSPADLNHGMADRQQTGGLLDMHHIGTGCAYSKRWVSEKRWLYVFIRLVHKVLPFVLMVGL